MGKARFSGSALDGDTVTLTAVQGLVSEGPVNIPSWGSVGSSPTISGVPTITGTPEVGEVLTAVPAPVTADPASTPSYRWLRGGAEIDGADTLSYTVLATDDATSISFRQIEANARGVEIATSAPVGIGVGVIEYQIVYQGVQSAGGTTSDSFSVPVPGSLTGDWTLYVVIGASDSFTDLTVDGNDAPRIVPSALTILGNNDTEVPYQTAGAGGRMSVFEIGVTGLTGSGSLELATTLLSSDQEYVVSIVAVRGGILQNQFDELFVGLGEGGEGGFAGVEVPGDNSFMLGFTSGKSGNFADEGDTPYPDWSTLENQSELSAEPTSEDTHGIAWRANVPAGVYDEGVDFNANNPDRVTMALLVFVPIGAAIPAARVSQWTLTDEAAVTGDLARLDIQANPYLDGFRVDHYEIEIQKASGTVIERVLGGDATGYVRKHRMDPNTTTTCRLRPVYMNTETGVLDNSTAWSDPQDVPTTTGSARVTITASRTTAYIGEAFLLEIDARGFNSTRNQVAELDFWTTVDVSEHGDLDVLPALYTGIYGQKVRHICRAHMWAFAARTAGTKTFTTTVRDMDGHIAVNTTAVTILDPLTEFAATDIHALSTTGNFTGLPSGANTYTSFAAFKASMPTSGDVLMMVDQDEASGDGLVWEFNDPGSVHFRSYGDGSTRPELNTSIKSSIARLSWDGINIDTGYDPSDYPGGVGFRPEHGFDTQLCADIAVSNSNLRGCNIAIKLPKKGRRGAFFNIGIFDWANFATFGDDVGKYAIFGFALMQHPRVIRAPDKSDNTPGPVFPDHGPNRTSRPTENFAICKGVNYSSNSWGGVQSPQPSWRLFGSGWTPRPLGIMLSECLSLMMTLVVGRSSRSGGLAASRPQDVRIDSCAHFAGNAPTFAMNIKCGLTTVTNQLLVSPGGPRELNPYNAGDSGGSGLRAMILTEADHLVPFPPSDNANNPVTFRNLTLVDLNSDAETSKSSFVRHVQSDSGFAKPFTDVTFENIVEHAPNYANAETSDAPLADDYLGNPHPYQSRFYFDLVDTVIEETQYGVDNAAMCLWDVETGSAAEGSATGNVPPRGALGDLRPTSGANRGWI